jgi:hypothetical protein
MKRLHHDEESAMRTLFGALLLLLLAHPLAASERWAFWDRTKGLDGAAWRAAVAYLDCTDKAAKEAARSDKATPSRIMTEWAAGEAAGQCLSEWSALETAAGQTEAAALKAIVYRASVETALKEREGPEPIACAAGSDACLFRSPVIAPAPGR